MAINLDKFLEPSEIAGASGGVISRVFTVGVVVGDAVYQKSDGSVDKASAVSLVTAPAIGFVTALNTPSPGVAEVRVAADASLFVGLTAGRLYILSKTVAGILWVGDTLNPAYPSGPGNIVQTVGVALSATTLLICASPASFVET
jgi:hypothetical protein